MIGLRKRRDDEQPEQKIDAGRRHVLPAQNDECRGDHRCQKGELQRHQTAVPAPGVRDVHQGLGQPLVVDPGAVAGERIRIGGVHGAGREDVLAEAHVAEEIGVGARVRQHGEHDGAERETQQRPGMLAGQHSGPVDLQRRYRHGCSVQGRKTECRNATMQECHSLFRILAFVHFCIPAFSSS